MWRELVIFILLVSIISPSCRKKREGIPKNMPNVILLMADDLGYGDLAGYGNLTIKTPHLDDMANSSVKFTKFFYDYPTISRCAVQYF